MRARLVTDRSEKSVIVSACLLGLCTRYDGESCTCEELISDVSSRHFLPLCPEQLGGLPTPRPPAEISRGDGRSVLNDEARVLRRDGVDVTPEFLGGGAEILHVARLYDIDAAYLKEGSPSCGVTRIKRDGAEEAGCGVTTAMLEREGVRVEGFG